MSSTPVHFSKGENPILSNFYSSKIIYKGRQYACVEGAYQAHKSGVFQEGFEELDGYASKRRARALNLGRRDDEFVIDLMRELLQARAEQDPDFVAALMEADNITHPVGQAFWREWFPRLLNQLKAKLESEKTSVRWIG